MVSPSRVWLSARKHAPGVNWRDDMTPILNASYSVNYYSVMRATKINYDEL
jgi:hypothetical protein